MYNPFSQIFSSKGIFNDSGGNSVVGVDIGTSSIKVVELKKKGGKVLLETYGAIALGPYADVEVGRVTNLPVEKTSEALREVLKQSGVNSKSAAFAIPVQSSLIFTLSLAAQIKDSDLASIVPVESRRYIPVPINEVSIDYFVLPEKEPSFEEMHLENGATAGENKKNILVVATQNDAVSRYRSIVAECDLLAPFFEIEIFSSVRSNFEHELSLVLLMDFGASRTKLSLVEFGTVKSYHTIDRGGGDITDSIARSLSIPFTEAEKMKKEYGLFGSSTDKNIADIIKVHTDYIFSEANSVVLAYEKKYNKTVSKVIFSGGGALMKGLKEVAAGSFQAPIEMGHPFSKVGAPAFLDKVLSTMGPEFAVSIGLALRKLQ